MKNIKIAYLPVDSRDVYGKKIYNTLMQIMEEPKKSKDIKEKTVIALYDFMRGDKDAEELGV